VPDLVIQPTKKWIRLLYWMAFLTMCVSVGVYINKFQDSVTPWILLVPALLFVFPLHSHIGQRFTKVTLTGDKLRYETGLTSRTTRTIQMTKVQDVRVDQSLWQRLVGVGNLTIETAGETSQLTIENIDRPQSVADLLADTAQGLSSKPKGGRS
jgi:uncharacterized membrane protein YdbT with pleckstrin-like domain